MHENPEPTEEEHEQAATERHRQEDAMRYPEHDDPEGQRDRAREEDE
ncbi:MAG TPA: hypothetical protein VGF23_23775 [Gaiellaceae bacterium]|jgi:hypothetical protein